MSVTAKTLWIDAASCADCGMLHAETCNTETPMKQITLTADEIARIQQAIYVAHCYSVEHRHTYAMFCDKVNNAKEQSMKDELAKEVY